ncbi:MAG: hypothetical protein ABI446_09320 [Gemmatimonadaceae bacterium]
MRRLLTLNLLFLLLLAAPLGALELIRDGSEWAERHREGIGVVLWFFTLK